MEIFLKDNRKVRYGVYVLRLIYKLENCQFCIEQNNAFCHTFIAGSIYLLVSLLHLQSVTTKDTLN